MNATSVGEKKEQARLNILHLEDDSLDVQLVQSALERAGMEFELRAVSSGSQFVAALEETRFDVILSDNTVPGLTGAKALELAQARQPEAAFIFLSGAIEAIQPRGKADAHGASDCVPKSRLETLADVILRSTRTARGVSNSRMPDGYVRSMERLVEVVQELSLARDLPAIMEIVRHAARELTGADGATFVLRDGGMCHYAEEDAIAPLWKGRRFPLEMCVSGWVMLNRQPAVIADIYTDSRVPADAYRPTFVKSLVMVPIRTADPVGAIGNYWATRRQPRPEEIRLLQALADSTSVAIENVQLYASLEQKVADRTARLEAANQELEAFSYSVSHDLRAPLRHVAGYIEMLRNECGEEISAEGRRFARIIADSASRMGTLIDDLLSFSRMGRAEMQQVVVNTNDMVSEVIGEMGHDTRERVIAWQVDPLPEVKGDRAMLRQVWVNFLSNAVKYTRGRARAEVRVSATRLADSWQFAVQDNGVGFNNGHSSRLFGVFQRLHRDDEFEGTGIGLALARRIIARHGGRAWGDGRPGEGATFFFTLPAEGQPQSFSVTDP